MSQHSFPPRLSDAEYRMLQAPLQDTASAVVQRLLRRGLLYEAPNPADLWPEVTVTKRGALMLRRATAARVRTMGKELVAEA